MGWSCGLGHSSDALPLAASIDMCIPAAPWHVDHGLKLVALRLVPPCLTLLLCCSSVPHLDSRFRSARSVSARASLCLLLSTDLSYAARRVSESGVRSDRSPCQPHRRCWPLLLGPHRSKGKNKEKVNNLVLFDKGTYDKLVAEVPK